ncbi:MAG: hypothetical protein ACR2IP_04570 [Solirubrobacteraceae bacterium]
MLETREAIKRVGPVDLDPRQLSVGDGVAAASAAGTQQHAAVDVGAVSQRGDRPRRGVGTADGDEQAAHPAVGDVADLDQSLGDVAVRK